MIKENIESGNERGELVLSNPPHIRASQSVTGIMWMVIAALIPAVAYSINVFGLKTLYITIAGVITAVISEAAYQLLMKKKVTVGDGSAVITGLLLVMNVPPDAPIWMVCIGSAFSVIIVKQLFGGIGFNIFNPALAGRAFLLASWPVYMTTKWHTFSGTNIISRDIYNNIGISQAAFDAITSATPLTALKGSAKLLTELSITPDSFYNFLLSDNMLRSLFIGDVGGCIGETSALLLLAGALFLFYKRIITWHIPLSYIGSVIVIISLYYGFNPPSGSELVSGFLVRMVLFHILSGGLVLGAFFMATDMVTSPVTRSGMIFFGIGCGVITCVIRIWGGYPEGVSYSILLMNATVPLIDRMLKPVIFGAGTNDQAEG